MKKRFLLSFLLVTLLLFTLSPLAVQAKSDGPGEVNATNIELVKKVTLKGPGAKGGKPAPVAATGVLGAPCNGNKYGIIIGIEDYPGTSNDLQYTVDDADEMYNVLTNTYGFLPGNVRKLTNAGANKTAILDAVNFFKDVATVNDEVVFFFSGHGAKGKANDGDANSTDQSIVVWNNNQFGYIWDGELVQWFTGFKTSRIVFIFDSCLSGGMSVLKTAGRVVNMACSATGLSYEGAQWGGGHGQFTYYFAEEGMHNNHADLKAVDDIVTVEEAFDYAKANCVYQAPTIADGFERDLAP